MANSTTNISLTKPEATDVTLIREDFNDNMDIIDGRFSSTYMAVQAKASVDIDGGSITGITDLAIADGGTASSTAAAARTALSISSRALDNIASCAINAALLLGTSDAAALGSATKMWADLFLASGAVINFNNGDVALTHSSNTLTLTGGSLVISGAQSKGIEITGANSSAQLYIGGSNILANGEQAIYVNCPSEDGATNAMWLTLGSTVVTGDVTGARIKVTTNATTGGDTAGGQNVRGVYSQAIAAASKHAGLLQGGLFTADVSAGSVTAYNVHVLCGHYSSGASTTIGGDLYVGYLRSQTRSTNSRTVTGKDCLLALENEAIEGSGAVMDSAIRIFDTNVAASGFTYGIDLSDSVIATADIRLSNGETISNTTDSRVTIGGGDVNIDTGKKYLINGTTLAPTNLAGTAWRVFYSNTDGDVTELALGADGTYLKSNGAAVAPTFGTPAGAGDVTKVGTPANDQVGVWTGDGTIEGHASFTYASGTGTVTATEFVGGGAGVTGVLKNTVEDTTPELGGEMDCGAHSIGFTIQSTTGDGTTTIDWRLGNKFKFTFGAQNDTFTFTAPTNPCTLILTIIQDGTGSRTATFPATVKWAGGSAPTLSTAANARDKIALDWDGSQYDAVANLAFA